MIRANNTIQSKDLPLVSFYVCYMRNAQRNVVKTMGKRWQSRLSLSIAGLLLMGLLAACGPNHTVTERQFQVGDDACRIVVEVATGAWPWSGSRVDIRIDRTEK